MYCFFSLGRFIKDCLNPAAVWSDGEESGESGGAVDERVEMIGEVDGCGKGREEE